MDARGRIDPGKDAYHERLALGAIALAQWRLDPK
jgi:hypothetical protein